VAPSRVRVYGRLRTAVLERLAKMVPAQVLYTGTRYDFDLSEADPNNPPVQLTRLAILRELGRRHHDAVEINEPASIDRFPFLLALVLVVRVRSRLARRPSTIAAYCMANADPALEVQARWRLPLGVSRLVVRVVLGVLVRGTDRLAFATVPSAAMYEGYVGRSALARRARTFVAIPAPCDCLPPGEGDPRPEQLVFVGGLLERKGVRPMLEAWEELHRRRPEATFLVIGMGRLEGEVTAWAADRPEVQVVIDPPRSTIHDALRESAVLILLSQRQGHWREQIGEPIQEGLSHGCEIVTTTETGLADWLTEHGHAVVAPGTAAAEVAAQIDAAFARAARRRGSVADLPSDDQRFAADRWMMTGA
jgi:glycosyltransferase involved in cell wall biosynthesis